MNIEKLFSTWGNFFLVCRICFWTHFAFIEFKLIKNYKLLTKIFETKIKLKNDLFCQHYSFSQFQFNVWTFFLYARRFDLNKATNQIASFYLASYTVCILVLTDEWRLEGLFQQGKLRSYERYLSFNLFIRFAFDIETQILLKYS